MIKIPFRSHLAPDAAVGPGIIRFSRRHAIRLKSLLNISYPNKKNNSNPPGNPGFAGGYLSYIEEIMPIRWIDFMTQRVHQFPALSGLGRLQIPGRVYFPTNELVRKRANRQNGPAIYDCETQ